MSYQKINAFSLSHDEAYLFAGEMSGRIQVLKTQSLETISFIDSHQGEILNIVTHPVLPWIASIAGDRHVCVHEYDSQGTLTLLHRYSLRGHRASNVPADIFPVHSNSTAVIFHPTKPLVASRTATGSVLEASLSQDKIEFLRCYVLDQKNEISTLQYTGNGDELLIGNVKGGVFLYEHAELKQEWKFGDETIHWFERIGSNEFLIASDMRMLVKLNTATGEFKLGPSFARDDLEHVVVHPASKSVFATSFDRNLYEIDRETCAPLRVAYQAPLKQTPAALWTSIVTRSGVIELSGEGKEVQRFSVSDASDVHQVRSQLKRLPGETLGSAEQSYVKRMDYQASSELRAYGLTNGILALSNGIEVNLGSAVRDLIFSPHEPFLFACLESGRLLKVHANTGEILAQFETDQPLWSLSLNPERGLIVTAERIGKAFALESDRLSVKSTLAPVRLPKRMKWFSKDRLLLTHSAEVHEWNPDTNEVKLFLKARGNTVEDFGWTADRRYLVTQTYQRELNLFDATGGQCIWVTADQTDYSKGILFLNHENRWACFNPSFAFLLAVVGFLIAWRRLEVFQSSVKKVSSHLVKPVLCIFLISVLVQILSYSKFNTSELPGMLEATASVFATSWLPFFSTALGAFGAFVSGSATVSNLLFASLQADLARSLSYLPGLILSLQLVGAGLGNMIALSNCTVVQAAVQQSNQERKIIAEIFPYFLIYLIAASLLGGSLVVISS